MEGLGTDIAQKRFREKRHLPIEAQSFLDGGPDEADEDQRR